MYTFSCADEEEQAEAQVDSTEPETNDLADEGLEDAESDVDDDALTGEAAFEKALADNILIYQCPVVILKVILTF